MLACVATVLVVLVAGELGGGRRAQMIAAFCAAASAFVLAVGHMVSTATFDMLAWVVSRGSRPPSCAPGRRLWIAIGAAVGLAVQNKYLVGLLVVALLGHCSRWDPAKRCAAGGWPSGWSSRWFWPDPACGGRPRTGGRS